MDIQKKITNLILLLFSVTSITCSATQPLQENLYIRVNQVGYLPSKPKHGVIFADKPIKNTEFRLIEVKSGKEVYKGYLSGNLGSWGDFGFNYKIDFSDFAVIGKYRVVAGGKQSSSFSINAGIYSTVADSLLEFFKIQRCGPTNPKLHKICHIYDSPRVDGDNSVTGIDVTGGWHDAGDYIKFLNTSAYTTYMLLLSYDLNRSVSDFDNDKNSVPDILEEAKVGIDWLIRCNYKDSKLITQVQDNRDHDQGWRLPENDPIKFDRPAFAGKGKSIIGLYSATLALAAKIWRDRFKDNAAADKFLAVAEKMYAIRGSVPDVDVTNTGMYSDRNYLGKLALGAIELYNATKKDNYLQDAKEYSGKAQSDYWWSWGDMNSLAHFRIGAYARENIDFINSNLIHFNSLRQKNIYEEGAAYSWGTTNTLLGCALQAVFFKISTGKNDYDSLIYSQLDFVFGKNPWGISFFHNFGEESVRHLHSQVAFMNGGYLPGGISAGPAPVASYNGITMIRQPSKLDRFNTKDVQFFDDKNDYISNEPTIVTNATALFLFLYLQQQAK